MTKFETFYAAALGNSTICNGVATQRELNEWFGKDRSYIGREEIAAFQALRYARVAMKSARIDEGQNRYLSN